MKYIQPYGIVDENASYINGNPATGTMGSIPPAASIEHPQREITNLLTDAGLTPSVGDLHQLAKGVQSNKLNYGVDTGVANVYAMNVNPPLLAYAAGQRWVMKVLNTNTGPATLSINGLTARQIKYPNGTALGGGEMQAGAVVGLLDDGTKLQLQNVAANLLSAPLHYYVNASTGNDTTLDGSQATVSGSKGPFATIGKALDATVAWNQNGYSVTIHVADGTNAPFISRTLNGSGQCIINGNVANPSACVVAATAGPAIQIFDDGYVLDGFKVTSAAAGPNASPGSGVRASHCILTLRSMDYGVCFDNHIQVDGGGLITQKGTVSGDPTVFQKVSGNAANHIRVGGGASLSYADPILQIPAAITVGVWASVANNSTFTAVHYQSITGFANVTGQKYNVNGNGVIDTNGSGINYLPGTVAGATSTGGQYT